MEEGRKLYEVMDLGVGKCRMCVCGPESARERLEHHELIRVATKYPNIAKDYFYNQKYQTVEIIKLNGSIELAPIVGLSEVIVDIVETGSTLRENGLCLLYTSLGFPSYAYFVLKQMEERGIHLTLPGGSKMILSGGWKQFEGQKVNKEVLYGLARRVLGIEDKDVAEFFSAAEHPVLYCDCRNHHFHCLLYTSRCV